MAGLGMKELPKAIEDAGYGFDGYTGGIPRQTYYTPDGRTIRAIPGMRDYVIKDALGKVIESGTRDTNLDRGWLLTKPTELKLYCRHCDKWHDTQEEIDACGIRQNRLVERFSRKVKKEYKEEETDQIAELQKRIAELEAKLTKPTRKRKV